jgi:hypothetical protein
VLVDRGGLHLFRKEVEDSWRRVALDRFGGWKLYGRRYRMRVLFERRFGL